MEGQHDQLLELIDEPDLEAAKKLYLMQFMDPWTFDSVRMSKCSCIHLLPEGKMAPSCGCYSYHRRSDPRFPSQP